MNIHYIHVVPKPSKPTIKVIPLLLLHGWPGSVREFYEFIPLVTKESPDRDFVFEVIAPSLPGYGFSEAAAKQGLDPEEMGVIFRNLMLRLGKNRFYVQGGDWGSMIGSAMATYFTDNVIGFHTNMCFASTPIGFIKNIIAETLPKYFIDMKHHDFFFPSKRTFVELLKEMGYMHIQATKPDTIGAVLAHNPVGLAAYILEKFSTWTNPQYRDLADGGLEKYFTLDALIDNLMFYYIPNSITSSQRLYKESFSGDRVFDLDRVPTETPFACARFKHELAQTIDWVLQDKYKNMVQANYFQDGGHFAAMQLPKVLYKDFVEFVKKVEKK